MSKPNWHWSKTIRGKRTTQWWIDYDDGLLGRAVEGKQCVVLEAVRIPGWVVLHREVCPQPQLMSSAFHPTESEMSKFLKASLAKAAKQAKATNAGYSAVSPKHPALSEFLTVDQLDGKARQTATLSVFHAQGVLRCFLNDRESRMSLCVSADTFDALLDALEASLTSDDPGWRSMDGGTKKKGK